jgi:hypothetical protein
MTSFDLRLFYRRETGYAPTWGRTKGLQSGPNYKGAMTHEYAVWLEEYAGEHTGMFTMTWQRYYYFKETGKQATYYDNYRNLRYNREYKLWMEDLLCKVLTGLDYHL